MPRLDYLRTSEIPAALGKLSSEELGSVLEARLRGESAGLPAPDRDEDPGAILRYAFDQGDAAFKERFKQVLAQVLGRNLRALALADSPALNGRRRLLEGVFFLIGQTGDREALPTVRRFLPVVEFLDTSLVQRLLGCIAVLAGPEDTALVPWLLEKATSSEYSRIALRGLFRIHRPSAAAALPTVARSLLGREEEASLLLARVLALLLPSLPDAEQVEFIKQVGSSLRILASLGVTEMIVQALEGTPGISPRAMQLAQSWPLIPSTDLVSDVREEPSGDPPFPEDRVPGKASRAQDLLLAMAPLVKRVAIEMRSDFPPHVEMDVLVEAGTLGLVDALQNFDPSRKVKLENYVRHRVRGAILDALRTPDAARRNMRRRVRKVEKSCRELEARLGRPVQGEEVARALGISSKVWHRWAQEVHSLGFDALQNSETATAAAKPPVGEKSRVAVPQQTEAPFDLWYRRELRDLLKRAVASLSERDRLIVSLYSQHDLTMKEIASRLAVDESRVSQLQAEALQRLKARVQALLSPPRKVKVQMVRRSSLSS